MMIMPTIASTGANFSMGFHNDSTAHYDKEDAELARSWTVDF
jgi:hypothetical protein